MRSTAPALSSDIIPARPITRSSEPDHAQQQPERWRLNNDLGGGYAYAYGINDAGQIVGQASTTNDDAFHAYLRPGGPMVDLMTLGGSSSNAGINSGGLVVGYSVRPPPARTRFDGVRDLNALIPAGSNWT
jgi:probable HAF family extracellular repeat protein